MTAAGENEKKRSALEILKNYSGPDVRIMEVCGTHTHEIFRLESGSFCQRVCS